MASPACVRKALRAPPVRRRPIVTTAFPFLVRMEATAL